MKKNILGLALIAGMGTERLNRNWNQNGAWNGANGNGWSGADANDNMGGGAAAGNDMAEQQPYIIQVVNSCASAAVADVVIGNSYKNRSASNFGQSTLITITSTVTDVDYIEFLAASESNPFTVGKTMIISSNSGQIEQTVQVKHKTAAGTGAFFVISSTLSPFQQQTDRIIDNTVWVFDGYTTFTFNQVNAGATVTSRFYLKNKFNATRIIADQSGVKSYQNPDLIGVGAVVPQIGG